MSKHSTFIRGIKDKDNPYVMIRKNPLNDTNLSLKAKGLISILLSLPDDWQIYETELVKRSRDGRDSVRSTIKELIDAGYIERERSRRKDGTFGAYQYTVWEVVEDKNHHIGKSNVGESNIGKPDTTNNNTTNNNLTNSINSSAKAKPHIPYKEIIEYLNEEAGRQFSYKANGNRGYIKARANEGYNITDFKKVVDNKVKEWKDTDMEKYLRPSTLFGNKFDMYLNDIIDTKKPQSDKSPYGHLNTY